MASMNFRERAKELFKQINPSETDENLELLVNFGLHMAISPESLISVLETEVKLRKNN